MTALWPRAGSFAVVTVMAGLAGGSFHRAFGWGPLTGPVALAAVVPVIAVALLAGTPRRRRVPLSLLAWAALWLGVVAVTLFWHGSPTVPGVLPAVGDGLLNGWARLLAVTLPAPDPPDLLVVPQALTWLAAGVGAELVARTRTVLLPAVPAVVVFVAGVTLTVSAPGSNLLVAAALVAASGLLILCRRAEIRSLTTASGRGGSGSSASRAVIGVVAAVAVAAASALIGPLLSPGHGRDPYDIRAHRTVPLHPISTVNPLDQVAAWLGDPGRLLFAVRASAAQNGTQNGTPDGTPDGTQNAEQAAAQNIRLAVLDRFDGQSWTSSARFQPAGRQVPAVAGELPRSGELRQDVEIDGLDGVWLPAMDRPVRLDGVGLAVDVDSGVLLSAVPVRPGRRYTVVSAPQTIPDATVLALSQPATDADADAARYLPPGLPDSVREAARRGSVGRITPFQQAFGLEQYLRGTFSYDSLAPAGHTYGHLNYFLTRSQRGTSEQFATVFAVAARVLGLPSRVVVGFAFPPGGPRTADVHTGDVLVWPEIDFAGVGWLPFYPTPQESRRGGTEVASSASGESSERARRAEAAAAVPVQYPAAPPSAPPVVRHTSLRVYVGVISGAVVLACALGYLAVAAGSPVARRRRGRRARIPRTRVVGAWHSTHDALAGAGIAIPAAATPAETVGIAAAGIGASGRASLASLADLVTTALFAANGIGPAEADKAWLHEKQVRAQLRRVVPLHRRMAGRLAPSQVIRGRRYR
ncbi:transglutaminase domain-containing protein [Frankia sp. Cj5]|uniref:transglutaminase domain-containing protein n=1 Tax=Frankia sp. Cj5 TaxID=2880978 RepID=UPI001EF5282C|nr:transglutaminase domain-containing protein [Frankia sp. Cj5]